ncbi:MAG TPA: M23 family metallopeptidase [Candidatus Binatia bacterium]|jgi:murein DD-endopeptidase MepM/ murein hydrolase activator NlpD
MRSARHREQRDGIWRRRFGVVTALVLVTGTILLLVTKLEWHRPTAELAHPLDVLGRTSTIDVRIADLQTGLSRSRVEIESGGTTTVLANEEYPAASWRKSSVPEKTLSIPLQAIERKIPEGPLTIRVFADDYSWLRFFRGERPALEVHATVDVTPPTLEVLSTEHNVKVGGVEFLVYKVSSDAVQSGVQVDKYFFPGSPGMFDDPGMVGAFFAVPQDLDTRTTPKAVAVDAAGNRREVNFHTVVKPRKFADKTMPLDDAFLERKVPELLAANGAPPQADLVQGYLFINRTLRKQSEERIKEATRTSAKTPLWDGAFMRQPNSSPLSGFADRRSYVYKGATIDTQTHLGFDLASLRQSPVTAASNGSVVFAGPLGIYGDAVILDHGLGIFSLYGHLSAIMTKVAATVQRGDTIGRTGETGLAGGDHLHFSVMLWGTHVDPVEWWDGKWIHDHVTAKLDAYPRTTATARRDN